MFLTISGPSCAGKDTTANFLFDIISGIDFLPSQTTRAPRTGDRGYVHVTDEEFEDMKKEGLFAWSVGPFGNKYGTLISDLEKAGLEDDIIWVAIITPDTVEKLRVWVERLGLGQVLSVYLYCSDEEEYERRLTIRGDKDIKRRLEECRNWDLEAKKHDFFIWVDNGGDLDKTRKTVLGILINNIEPEKPQ